MTDDTVMSYKKFCHGYERYKEAARRVVRFRIKEDSKWKREAERFMHEVAVSFNDRERNFRRWLALEKCIFRNPMTDEYVAVSIGDNPEALYYFLLFCKKLNYREDIDETFMEYAELLISNYDTTERYQSYRQCSIFDMERWDEIEKERIPIYQ